MLQTVLEHRKSSCVSLTGMRAEENVKASDLWNSAILLVVGAPEGAVLSIILGTDPFEPLAFGPYYPRFMPDLLKPDAAARLRIQVTHYQNMAHHGSLSREAPLASLSFAHSRSA